MTTAVDSKFDYEDVIHVISEAIRLHHAALIELDLLMQTEEELGQPMGFHQALQEAARAGMNLNPKLLAAASTDHSDRKIFVDEIEPNFYRALGDYIGASLHARAVTHRLGKAVIDMGVCKGSGGAFVGDTRWFHASMFLESALESRDGTEDGFSDLFGDSWKPAIELGSGAKDVLDAIQMARLTSEVAKSGVAVKGLIFRGVELPNRS